MHEVGFAKEVATRVMFMDSGGIQEENNPNDFFANPQNTRLTSFCLRYCNYVRSAFNTAFNITVAASVQCSGDVYSCSQWDSPSLDGANIMVAGSI